MPSAEEFNMGAEKHRAETRPDDKPQPANDGPPVERYPPVNRDDSVAPIPEGGEGDSHESAESKNALDTPQRRGADDSDPSVS